MAITIHHLPQGTSNSTMRKKKGMKNGQSQFKKKSKSSQNMHSKHHQQQNMKHRKGFFGFQTTCFFSSKDGLYAFGNELQVHQLATLGPTPRTVATHRHLDEETPQDMWYIKI